MDETYTTKLMARNYYLKKLLGLNLVTPSIHRPFPRNPENIEEMITHNAMMQIQKIRSKEATREINQLVNNGHGADERLLEQLKKKFDKKISHLKEKFNPYYKHTCKKKDRKERNRKHRERYRTRKMNKQINLHAENNGDNVINLSSHNLDRVEKFVLELGHGFVPTPNNSQKEEEMLIVEGLRVTDRIRKLDYKLMNPSNEPDRNEGGFSRQELEEIFNNSNDETFHGFTPEETPSPFIRPKNIPDFLRYSQPTEGTLQHPTTKKIQKEFDEFSNQLINKALKTKRKTFNLPKNIRDAIKKLKTLVKTQQIDIRKVDKGQMILVIDYTERKKIEEMNISKIASVCVNQSSNWQENRRFVEEKVKALFNLEFVSKEELAAVTGVLAPPPFLIQSITHTNP